jgi:hypothetical protein
MFSSSLASLLVQAKVEDLTRPRPMFDPQHVGPGANREANHPKAARSISRGGRSISRFFRHYVEMVAVMFVGMFTLGMPAGWVLRTFGASSPSSHHPAMMLFSMAVTMTVPMVAWMRYRGHTWQTNMEMAASMIIPTIAVLGLLWTGLASGVGMLMVIEHAAMLAFMLFAMLLRLDEYAGAAHAHGATPRAVTA